MPRVALPVLAGLFAGVLFLASNVAALHKPWPHGAPVAIAGAPAAPLQRALDRGAPGAFTVTRVASVTAALRRRDAYAGLDVRRRQVLVASANGFLATAQLKQALAAAAPRAGVAKPTAADVVPLQKGDPRGLSLQQIVLGTIIGGFLMGVMTAQLALGEPLWQRGSAYVGFAAVFGCLVAIVLDPLLGVLRGGHFLVIWAWASAAALAIAVSVGAAARLVGQLGVPLAMLVFLIVGNPSAAANAPTEFLPAFYRAVGPWLPPNADASGLLGSTYFHASVLRPALVLAAWILVPALVLLLVDRRRGSRRALVHDAALHATDREDRAVEPLPT